MFLFQLVVAVNNLKQEKIENTTLLEKNSSLKNEKDAKHREIEELCKEIDSYKYDNCGFLALHLRNICIIRINVLIIAIRPRLDS